MLYKFDIYILLLIIHSVVALIDVFCNQFFLQIEKQISISIIYIKKILRANILTIDFIYIT